MKLGGIENKARLAMALFVLALLLMISLSLTLYSQARRELADQGRRQVKLEAALLASAILAKPSTTSEGELKQLLLSNGIAAEAAVFLTDGKLIAHASTLDRLTEPQPLLSRLLPPDSSSTREASSPEPASSSAPRVRTETGLDIAEVSLADSRTLILARPVSGSSSPFIVYVFSYQIIALVLGLGLMSLFIRRLLRPYHRMVEAARGSPVHATAGVSESEFVVETFQALVEQLHTKERELAQLHAHERKRAERSERFSERLIASIPSGLVAIDAKGMVTSANLYASEIFGSTEPAAAPAYVASIESTLQPIGIDYGTFFAAAPRMLDLVSECLSRGASFRREEVDVTHADGRVRHLGLSISPITDASHHVEGALCLMTDITEVIELRERMKLQENLANLGEMAAGLAHEFKNSLATIHGYVQLLQIESGSSNSAGVGHGTLEATLNEVRLLARLVTDFLNFAKPQQLSLTQVSLRSIVEDCLSEIQPRLDAAGIKIRVEGEFAELPGDEMMLRSAFANLLRNATEAIDQQSTERLIEVSGTIDPGRGGRYAHIRIRDTGGGISAQDLHRIFIPFFTTKSRGYGIGLAIVQKIIVAHGGAVAVEHSDRSGTVFHCRLPLSPSPITMELYSQVVN